MNKIAIKYTVLCIATILILTLVACGGSNENEGTDTYVPSGYISNDSPSGENTITVDALDLTDASNYFFILNGNRFYLWGTTVGDFNSLEEITVVTTFGLSGDPVTELEANASIDNLFIATAYGHFQVGAHNPHDRIIPIHEAIVDSILAEPAGRAASAHLGHLPARVEFAGGLVPGVSTRAEVEALLGAFEYPIGLRSHAFSACGNNRLIDIRRNRSGWGFTVNLDNDYISNRISISLYP